MRVILLFWIFALLGLGACGSGEMVGGPLPLLIESAVEGDDWDEINKDVPDTPGILMNGSPVMIRVLINTSNFSSRVHERVEITATGDFIVRGGGVLGGGSE